MDNEQEIKKLEIEELETKIRGMISERQYISNKIEEAQSKLKTLKIGSEEFYYLNIFGEIAKVEADNYNEDVIKQMKQQGNTFKTREEAEKESERRALLYEFYKFRDECNANEKVEMDSCIVKYYIGFYDGKLDWYSVGYGLFFNTFGYFHSKADCLTAIEKFGDRIRKLYID